MENIEYLNKSFSTADAEDVQYSSDGFELRLTFTDWQGQKIELLFDDVEYLKISDELDDKFRYDCPHEIHNSVLIAKLKIDSSYKHYMLCFNTWSNLEVVAQPLKILTKPGNTTQKAR